MKNIVRAFVVALALTGAVASAHTSNNTASASPALTKQTAINVPNCPPGDPNGCGIANW